MSESFNEMSEDDSVDELVQTLSEAISNDKEESIVEDLVNKIIAKCGVENPIIGNFIVVAEVITAEGDPHLMVSTSDRLPDWIARGMLAVAEDFIMGFSIGEDNASG